MVPQTKQEYIQLMYQFLNPLKKYYSKGYARLCLSGAGETYQTEVAQLESFSRPLWALVPFWMGGGRDAEFECIYRTGLANGTDPDHPEYWGGFQNFDQRFVEMAAISCGLILTPQILWDPLTAKEKKNVARWLYGINEKEIPACNWQFFRILVNLALKKNGMPYSSEKLKASFQNIERYYLGGGWYRDGDSNQKDYYVSFAIHYYSLMCSRFLQEEDPKLCACYRHRAMEFAQDFIYWFAENGAALPYGRSLIYRFGEAAFWSSCLFAGIQPFSAGIMKGIISRHLDYWMQQDIFDNTRILTVGYGYPNLIMSERYNAPGSPYWGMKLFLVLSLPNEDPFWQADTESLPPLENLRPMVEADLLIQRRNEDVVAYSAGVCQPYGHGHLAEKYAKFCYSTRFGFSCARSQMVIHEASPDSALAFVPDGSDYVFVRKCSDSWKVEKDRVFSQWSPFPGIQVSTTIIPTENGHVRQHVIESILECTAYDCGFAVEKFAGKTTVELSAHSVAVEGSNGFCSVEGSGEPFLLEADPNTNILFRNTLIPAVKYRIHKGTTELHTVIITR